VKNRVLFALSLVLITALTLPAFIYGQRSGSAQSSLPQGLTTSSSRERVAADAVEVEKDVSEALTIIQDQYIDGNKLDYNSVFKSSITGMLRSLDPHSNYFDRAEFDEFRTDQRSEYHGIGATIGDLRQGTEVNTYIRATFDNAPAARAGLRYGDRVLEVDGKDMRGKNFYEVRQNLRGPRGSIVKVTVERLITRKVETVEITRDAVPQPSIPESYMIRPGVGYVAMTGGFNTTTADEFTKALSDLHAQGMKLLVLDLRGNGGGLLSQAVRVANKFLQRGQLILTQKGRVRGSTQPYYADSEQPDTTPIVVIVSRGTASASEIVAGALQDHDRALIVGEPSFGKGLVQIPFPLEYGSALLLTIGKYYTPSGRLIQRDYSTAGFYDYYTQGGIQERGSVKATTPPTGPESRTDTGRTVYGGGGITPDETVGPRIVTPLQQRVTDPVFAFALELTAGRVPGFDAYKVLGPIQYGRDLKPTEFPSSDALFKAFKNFVASKPVYKVTAAQLDKERVYIERQIRYEVVTAAFGSITSFQVFNADDPQIGKAIDLLPRARDLALTAQSKRNPS
jgi:carboxyl-terminal processing protease